MAFVVETSDGRWLSSASGPIMACGVRTSSSCVYGQKFKTIDAAVVAFKNAEECGCPCQAIRRTVL